MRFLLSLFPALLAALSLFGWAIGSNQLRTDFVAQSPMAPMAAMGLLVLGGFVTLWLRELRSRPMAGICAFFTGLVMVASLVSVLQSAIMIYPDITFQPPIHDMRLWAALQISPSTAFAFLLLGTSILLLLSVALKLCAGRESEKPVRRTIAVAQALAMVSTLTTLFVLTGYLYHSISLTNIASLTPMPKVTALALLSLSLSVLAIYPRQGLMRFISNDGPSGQMAQFLLPVCVIVPVGLGWLRVVGMRAHLYDSGFGLDLSTMLNVVMLAGLTLISARKLYKSDQKARVVEQELLYRATHDSLTGLVNRPVFREQLTKRLRTASRRKGHPFAVFYLDLDGFKQVNDLLGHDAGDKLLVQVADMLRTVTRASDTVARFGGDEFVILFEEVDATTTAEHLADRILAAMPKTFGDKGLSVPIGISIGIATTEQGDMTPDEILREADTAMYMAKTKGKGCYKIAGAA